MFQKIFIESHLKNNPHALNILSHFKSEVIEIDSYDNYFNRVKKPYLEKRENLNLYIAEKKGDLIKEAPPAYGHGEEKHFYFIHAYNCLYECEYCYLQGYFHSPDLVWFINHDEILSEMKNILNTHSDSWFHAGEFSDSLALSHFTGELPLYFDFFKNHPNAKLELRTKSANTKALQTLTPLPNIYVSYSLSPAKAAQAFDLKTPSLKARLIAMEKLSSLGFKLAVHLDPIIYDENFLSEYQMLIQELTPLKEAIHYISLGVVRFPKDIYQEVQKNYPNSKLLEQEFITSFDNKVRYQKPMRMWMMNKIKDELLLAGFKNEIIYLCMEN
jgi:spore photoproduct lyase